MTKKNKKVPRETSSDQHSPQHPSEQGSGNPKSFPNMKILLLVITFMAGASVMIIELAGNRLLATWFGNSLFTLTGLIGIVLVSMSLGSYLGGYWADKFPQGKLLGHLLMATGLLTTLIPALQSVIDSWFAESHLIWGPLGASLILFAVPGLLLGSIPPFVVRLVSLISGDTHIGVSAGSISAFSTLGSVLGTFFSGFFLIPHFKITFIYYLTGLMLVILGGISYFAFRKFQGAASGGNKTPTMVGGALICLFLVLVGIFAPQGKGDAHLVHEQNTFYHRIRVYSYPMANGDRLKQLSLDTTSEGAQYEESKEIPIDYQKYWEISKFFLPMESVKRAAFLGGGAFTMPLAFADYYKESEVHVVELDPEVIKVGERFFKAKTNPRLMATADDARRFLRLKSLARGRGGKETVPLYDYIFGDTYNGIRYIPAHFVTQEFFGLVKQNLKADGIFVMNIISSIEGEKSLLFKGIAKTLQSVFPHVYVFVTERDFLNQIQNVILVGTSRDVDVEKGSSGQYEYSVLQLLSTYLPSSQYNLESGTVFSDLFNPVEFIVAQGLLKGRH